MKKTSFETLSSLRPLDSVKPLELSQTPDSPKNPGDDSDILGLTEAQVSLQRTLYGKNEIVESSKNIWLEIARDTIKDPMIWFLVGIGTIFLFVHNTSDAIVLFGAIVPLLFMDAFLHWRTQASTSSLKDQLATQVTVIRYPHIEFQVDSSSLVAGDLIKIVPGMFLPADGIFQRSHHLQIDESALTGESFPIHKRPYHLNPIDQSGASEITVSPETLGLAGTKVLSGDGLLRVLQIGQKTAYGEIVQSISSLQHERTPLQISMTKLVQGLLVGGGSFCLLLAGVRIYQGHGWLDAVLSAATLAVAAIPEEFPVVFTFFLGVGIYRLAKQKALIRRAVSVENIGRITTICTDKTGTLTRGRLELTHLEPFGCVTNTDLLSLCLAASNPSGLDPMDLSIQEACQKQGLSVDSRLRVFPFNEDTKRETAFLRDKSGNALAAIKGAPEVLLAQSILSNEEKQLWLGKIDQWASEGHKVLGCARKYLTESEVIQNIEPNFGLEFCGLLALEDPPRPEVASAIRYCNEQKIHVLMLTGDHPLTAIAVAKEIGLGGISPVMASAEDSPSQFEKTWLSQNPTFLKNLDIVARCTPLQKLNIVKAFKASGELIAVTGDGVNDVPALKAADIGIAMGERGSKSAKEVSSIILMDDNFQTITNAIKEGRQLFLNLKMSFEYLLLIHIPLVLTAALIPLVGYPLLYLPIHIVWLELIIHPTALFAFQGQVIPTTKHSASGPSFFSPKDLLRIVGTGSAVTAAMIYFYLNGLREGSDLGHGRSQAISLLVFWSASLVGVFTQFKSKSAALIALMSVISVLVLVETPSLAGHLGLAPLHLVDWLVICGVTVLCTILLRLRNRILSDLQK